MNAGINNIPFEDPDFEYFLEGTETKARCKHCGAVIDTIWAEAHKRECPARTTHP